MLHRDIYDLRGLTGAQKGIGTEKWASWVRDFGKPMTHTEADIGSNRLMFYALFDAFAGKKSRYEHFMTRPPIADEKLFQVGLGLLGRCVGTVESVCEVAGGKGSTESEEERKRVFRDWIDAAQVNLGQPDDGRYSDAASSSGGPCLGSSCLKARGYRGLGLATVRRSSYGMV
jgi:hypothetical protein